MIYLTKDYGDDVLRYTEEPVMERQSKLKMIKFVKKSIPPQEF